MFQSVWLNALIAGMVSACSMPLGSLTTLVWNPKNRALAFLMAFGGGALLAALVIDLVGSALEKGHIIELVIGSIIGSLFFTYINQLVNNSGGFLRKPSTTLAHLTQQERRRFTQSYSCLISIDLFCNLSQALRKEIAQFLLVASYPKGKTIYRQGDPSQSLYIVKKGTVELLDPQADLKPFNVVSANEIFGQYSFLTNSPHQTIAIAKEDCQLEILPRADFEQLLETSPEMLERTEQTLQKEAIKDYLHQRHELRVAQIKDWVDFALTTLRESRKIPPAVKVIQKQAEFLQLARKIRRFPVFSYLTEEELEEIAERLIYSSYPDGKVFFQPGDFSDRLYIIHQGEVEIIFPRHLQRAPLVLSTQEPFGEMSLVTEANHTVTAIAKTEVKLWTLRIQDFEEMLQSSPRLEASVKTFVEQPKLKDYLQTRQNFDATKATHWIQQALKSMDAGELIPSASRINSMMAEHKEAPMAIWLGLLMDGIPEALTIGAHIVTNPISPSLMAGLLLSNYPEALSSSQGMKQQGFSIPRILMMWTSLMLITGVLSAFGSLLFSDVPEWVISFLESMAAGAMLTVISETMLPEAYAKGGSIVGLSTLLGFLSIIVIKSVLI
ncbi:cyclic nucleotide-binding protein [Xenococcus sp. PCC 7305]|uniref:cyclic nucleotide-binding domain-containing protein n=1 Tax=Xenococcus sp. PCC 7305 TaxID=102125 RepID=UPI0002ABAA8F|nr:cyclic nucleotide-binding domain-containing protein [Xenococcus sp. PCC 7305]ELS01758.1 cyclic nucleotide-binding protein [Xenococcus sp. PCC 7305]